MYLVNLKNKLTANSTSILLLPAIIVLVTLTGITFLAWNNAKESLAYERNVASANIANDITSLIRGQLTSYEIVLTAAAGLITSSSDVTRQEWTDYIANFKLREKYPGIQGVGFAKYMNVNEIPSFIQSLEQEGLDTAQVLPKSDRSDVALSYFYHPFNKTGIGYNMMLEPTRREAILYAKNSGSTALTSKLNFVPGQVQSGGSGISMYLPVYANMPQAELPPTERKLEGFVFAPIDMSDFFNHLFATTSNKPGNAYHIKVYDSQADAQQPLYESPNLTSISFKDLHRQRIELVSYGRTWTIEFSFSPDVVSATTRERPIDTLITGIIISPIIASFVLLLLITRTRALSQAQQNEVNDVKDELLSLASHQLRTPATSVKQYIGMLKEGFAGSLTAQQLKLLDRAYDSNERQLHIINELLYVAKLDANGLVLTPRSVDLNRLIRTQARDLDASAKKSNQKIRLYLPRRPVFVEADEHCIAMAVENLISNALKYSYEGTTTTVRLTPRKQDVEISVSDRGVGIEPENIPLLFQRFSRIPNHFSRQISGSGIGLYLSQQLINLHGGSITVESVKDKSTTFTIHLPKKYIR